MRHLPDTTRLVLAALYLRLRDARRHQEDLLRRHGPDFPAYLTAKGQWTEAHNALQTVLGRVYRPITVRIPPREMLRFVARRAHACARTDAGA